MHPGLKSWSEMVRIFGGEAYRLTSPPGKAAGNGAADLQIREINRRYLSDAVFVHEDSGEAGELWQPLRHPDLNGAAPA